MLGFFLASHLSGKAACGTGFKGVSSAMKSKGGFFASVGHVVMRTSRAFKGISQCMQAFPDLARFFSPADSKFLCAGSFASSQFAR